MTGDPIVDRIVEKLYGDDPPECPRCGIDPAEIAQLKADNEAMERQLDYLNETPWKGHADDR